MPAVTGNAVHVITDIGVDAMTGDAPGGLPEPARGLTRAFGAAGVRWWIAGGVALELHTGTSWRRHGDLDLGVRTADAAAARVLLARCGTGRDGRLPCDLVPSDGGRDTWTYRRDRRIRVPWERAVLTSPAGVPYLAPELVLLPKSRRRSPVDEDDARHALPLLSPRRRAWLFARLPADHPWLPGSPGR